MIQGLLSGGGGVDRDSEVVANILLTDEFVKGTRPERAVVGEFFWVLILMKDHFGPCLVGNLGVDYVVGWLVWLATS